MRFAISIAFILCIGSSCNNKPSAPAVSPTSSTSEPEKTWVAPDTSLLTNSAQDSLIKYGRQLISNTAFYLGPRGSVASLTNGMNCQNCHLDAGTRPFGNNYSAVFANYPKYRDRSGITETIYKRINDCVERSLNGTALDTASHEIQAIKAYILWLGKDVPAKTQPVGAGLTELAYLDQAADPVKGKQVYAAQCQTCHGPDGGGKLIAGNKTYQYPPLWGSHSYNTGAGLFRISRLAGYVKSNMPFGIDYKHPTLNDEDAWNVAAYVNTQPRPVMDVHSDWPDPSKKPVDNPFGPYSDTFSERQHKYGPFLPIAAFKKSHQS